MQNSVKFYVGWKMHTWEFCSSAGSSTKNRYGKETLMAMFDLEKFCDKVNRQERLFYKSMELFAECSHSNVWWKQMIYRNA